MQLIFSADPKLVGKLIRWFTKISWVGQGRVSHSALRYGGKEANWMIESAEYGFVPNWFPFFERKRKIFAKYEILGIDEAVLEAIVDQQVDKMIHEKYDYGNLIGFALIIIWYKLTGKKTKNIFSWPKSLACTEVIYKIFAEVKKQTGIEFLSDIDPETAFPEQALQDCEKRPELFRKVED
jgi:hypothetical protein